MTKSPAPLPCERSAHGSGASTPFVLLVEDDREVRQMLEMLLRLESYEVATAENGRQALEVMRQRLPGAPTL